MVEFDCASCGREGGGPVTGDGQEDRCSGGTRGQPRPGQRSQRPVRVARTLASVRLLAPWGCRRRLSGLQPSRVVGLGRGDCRLGLDLPPLGRNQRNTARDRSRLPVLPVVCFAFIIIIIIIFFSFFFFGFL